MKTGRRIVLLAALAALVFASAGTGEAEDANSQLLVIGSIASPERFIGSVDGFMSTVADGVRGMDKIEPGALAMQMLVEFPIPLKTIDMDEPVYFLMPVGGKFRDLCMVISVPDFDEFIKGLDLYSSVDVADEKDPDSPRSAYFHGFGEYNIVKVDDRTVLLGNDDAALRGMRDIIGDLVLDHPEEWTASVCVYRPSRFDTNGVLAHGSAYVVGEIDGMRPNVAAISQRAGFNSKMLMGFADLLQAAIKGAVGEITALKEARLSVNFDKNRFESMLALTPDDDSLTELLRGAVGYLADSTDYEPKLAASVPAVAVGMGRGVLMLQDPDVREKLAEWGSLAADKLAPERKDEIVEMLSDRFASGNPSEAVQYFVRRGDRDVSIVYIQTDDAEAFIGGYEKTLKLAADLFNSLLGEAPGKGLRLGLSKLPGEGGDSYTLDAAVGLGSRLNELYFEIPRDTRAEIDKRLAALSVLVGRVGETVVVVSGSALPEDLAFAKGFLETPPGNPALSLSGASATLQRLPSGENGYYWLLDMRGAAELIVANLKKESEALDIDPDGLDMLLRAFIGGGHYAGFSVTADIDSLRLSASAPTEGVNEAVKNFMKLFEFIESGSFDDDE